MALAERLKQLRLQRRWSQQELAQRAGLTQPDLCRMEQGRVRQPRLGVLTRVADALGVSLDYLAGRTEAPRAAVETEEGFRELIKAYANASAAERQQLVAYSRFLKTQGRRQSTTRRDTTR